MESKKYQYVLFDLDGTLTDPKEGITKSVQYALYAFGIMEPNLDKLEPFIGPPLADSFMEFYHLSPQEAAEAVEKYRERFQLTGLYENVIYEGITELLEALHEEGRSIAIASSKPTVFVEKILKYFKIASYFDVVVGSELDGRRSKKEEVVEEALRQLYQLKGQSFPPKQEALDRTVMIGDRKFDIQGAKAYGIDSIGVLYGYSGKGELKEAGADCIVKTVKELRQVLLGEDTGRNVGKKKAIEKKESQRKESKKINSQKINSQKIDSQKIDSQKIAADKKTVQKTDSTACAEQKSLTFLGALKMIEPAIVHYVITSVVLVAASYLIFGWLGNSFSVLREGLLKHNSTITEVINSVGMVCSLVVLTRWYLPGKRLPSFQEKKDIAYYILLVVLSISMAAAINILFSFMGITENASETYERVSNSQYSIPVVLGLILYGVVSPFVEEVLFREIIYNRIKARFQVNISIMVTALLFGIYHMNLVQGLYGFCMGIMLNVLYEYFGGLKAAYIFHGIANIFIYLISRNEMLSKGIFTPGYCVLFAIISFFTLFIMFKRKED